MKNNKIINLIMILSIIIGFVIDDVIIGSTVLITGILNAIYATKKNKITYLFGLINYLLMAYVAFKNNLYGIFIFYTFIFAPLQIKGYIEWNKQEKQKGKVIKKDINLKVSILLITVCLIVSFILAYLLNLIPNQKLPFLDALANCINLSGVILLIFRFKEAWWIWLFNNIIELSIWTIVFINGGVNSFMMVLVSIVYLVINIYGIFSWNKF